VGEGFGRCKPEPTAIAGVDRAETTPAAASPAGVRPHRDGWAGPAADFACAGAPRPGL